MAIGDDLGAPAPGGAQNTNPLASVLGGSQSADVAAINQNVDGIHELEKEASKLFSSMNESLQGLYDELVKIVPGLEKSLGDDSAEKAAKIAGKSSNKKQPKQADLQKLPDAHGMPPLFIGTFLSQTGDPKSSWLAKIHDILKPMGDRTAEIAESMVGGGGLAAAMPDLLKEDDEKKDKDDKKDKDGKDPKKGIKGAIEGLIGSSKSLLVLAGTLVLFAGAAALFAVLNWPKALIGLAMFGVFIAGAILLTKFINKDAQQSLAQFGTYIRDLALAFILFGVAMLVASLVVPLVMSAWLGVLVIMGFFFIFSLLGALVSRVAGKGLKDFMKGSIMMTIAFLVFALGLIVIGKIVWPLINDPAVMRGIGQIFLLFVLFVLLGILASFAGGGLLKFALASILLIISMVIFAIGLVIIHKIISPLIDDPAFWKTIGLILGLFLFFVVLGIVLVVTGAILGLVIFAVAAILLALGLILFAFALNYFVKNVTPALIQQAISLLPFIGFLFLGLMIVGLIAALALVPIVFLLLASVLFLLFALFFGLGLLLFNWLVTPERIILALLTLPFVGLFFAGLLIVGLVAALALIPLVFLLLASLLFLLFALFFGLGLLLFNLFVTPERIIQALLVLPMVGLFFLAMIVVGLAAALALVPIVFLLVASILMFVSFLFFGLGLIILTEMVTTERMEMGLGLLPKMALFFLAASLAGLASVLAIPGLAFLVVASVLMMVAFVALWAAMAALDEISKYDTSKLRDTVEKINKLIEEVKKIKVGPIVMLRFAMLAAAMLAVRSIFEDTRKTFENIEKIKEVMDKVDVSLIMVPVEKLIKTVADAAQKMKGASLEAAVAFSIMLKSVTDAIDSIVNTMLKLKDIDKKLIEAAQANLKIVLNEFFGVGDNPSPYSILKVFEGVKGINKSQLRLAEALVPLTEAIKNITDTILAIKDIKPEVVQEAIVSLRVITNFIGELIPFTEQFKKGFFAGDSAKQAEIAATTIEAMIPMIENIKALSEKIADVKNIDTGISNLRSIVVLVDQLRTFSGKFTDGGFFSRSSEDQIKTAASSVLAFRPLLNNLEIISNQISNVQNIDRGIENLKTVVNLIDDLMQFSGKFKTGGWGTKSTEEEIQTANKTLNAFMPMLNNIKSLSSAIIMVDNADNGIANLRTVVELVDDLRDFIQKLKPDGWLARGLESDIKTVTSSLSAFIPLLKTLGKIEEMSGEFAGIKTNIEINVLQPLLKLDEGISKMRQLSNAVHDLNTQLKKLVTENKDAMKQLGDLNKGNGAGFKINLPILKSSGQTTTGANKVDDPLEAIAKDVGLIREKVAGGGPSWTGVGR